MPMSVLRMKWVTVKTSTTRGYAVLAKTPRDKVEQISKGLVKAMSHEVFANYWLLLV